MNDRFIDRFGYRITDHDSKDGRRSPAARGDTKDDLGVGRTLLRKSRDDHRLRYTAHSKVGTKENRIEDTLLDTTEQSRVAELASVSTQLKISCNDK